MASAPDCCSQVPVPRGPRQGALAQQAAGRFHALPDTEVPRAQAFGGGKNVAQVGRAPPLPTYRILLMLPAPEPGLDSARPHPETARPSRADGPTPGRPTGRHGPARAHRRRPQSVSLPANFVPGPYLKPVAGGAGSPRGGCGVEYHPHPFDAGFDKRHGHPARCYRAAGCRTSGLRGRLRLPWAPGRYAALRPPGWQVFCAGPGSKATAAWARTHGLPLTEIAPTDQETPGTLCLLRPDGHVGLAASSFDEKVFSAYLTPWVAVDTLAMK